MTKDTYTNPFWNDNLMGLKGAKLPWLDMEQILASQRRNMDLINSTQQIVAETTKAVIQLQAQYMKDTFDELSEQTKKNVSAFSPEEKIVNPSETIKAPLDQAIEHARNVNSLITQSSEKIIENVQKRFKEGMDESASIVKKTKTK